MQFIHYADRTSWARGIADMLAAQLSAGLDSRGRGTLIAAGGSTPSPIYQELSDRPLPWHHVTVMPSDERWVGPESDRSNMRMIRNALAGNQARHIALFPLQSDDTGIAEQGRRAGPFVEAMLPATAVLLGMGEDAHTASLFPNSAALADALGDQAPPLLPVRDAPGGELRMTLSMRVLRSAGAVEIAILGAEKLAALNRVGRSIPLEPVVGILDIARVHYAP